MKWFNSKPLKDLLLNPANNPMSNLFFAVYSYSSIFNALLQWMLFHPLYYI